MPSTSDGHTGRRRLSPWQRERLLILASSRKHGGRCIAGLSLDGNGLIRPVTGQGSGELSSYDTQLDTWPNELDVVGFGHDGFEGDLVQPENVVVDGSAWTTEGPMDAAEALRLIEPRLHTGYAVLGNRGNAVPAHVANEGMDESMCLIEPTNPEFVLNPELRPLARFSYSAKTWERPLTDFTVSNEVRRTGRPGTYSLDELGFETPRRVALLLSLATNHNDWHSKLAAGVLRFP